MLGLDKYQVRYHTFQDNLHQSCRLSIRLYLGVRYFFNTVRGNVYERDLFRMSVCSYQSWFQNAVVFWLHMFRAECQQRIHKALEIDRDMVVVTSLVKYSNSSVDAQTTFSEIAQEWRHVDIEDADTAIMGVTKITDMICDGARAYASKIQNILERNCYYDDNQDQFDVTDRMCITLNNIEHVRTFLKYLPQQLSWEEVASKLSVKHEDASTGDRSLATLKRLIQQAHQDILQLSAKILKEVCAKMAVELQACMMGFLVKCPEKYSSSDRAIGYLSTNLETLRSRLSETIYPHIASELWALVLDRFDTDMIPGKPPEYYDQLQQHLRALTQFFQSCWPHDAPYGVDTPFTLDIPAAGALRDKLDMCSQSSTQLMLTYFQDLAAHMTTPVDYLGHLAVKVAYMEETRGNVTVYVKGRYM